MPLGNHSRLAGWQLRARGIDMRDKGLISGFLEVFEYPVGVVADFFTDILSLLNEIIRYPIAVFDSLFNTSTI